MDENESDKFAIPKIKVFKPTDESLKLLGELLTNETSRRIILTLGESEMYVNKLAEKLDIRVSLVIHHLKKLGELGLLDIVEKPISKRTKDHKFFKLSTDVFLSFTEDKDDNKLKKLFRSGIKFTVIGIIGVSTFLITQIPSSPNTWGSAYLSIHFELSIILSLISIIIGLIV